MRNTILDDIWNRFLEAVAKHGMNEHDYTEWMSLLAEEVGEAAQVANAVHFNGMTPARLNDLRNELLDVAQVAYATIYQIDDRLRRLAEFDV